MMEWNTKRKRIAELERLAKELREEALFWIARGSMLPDTPPEKWRSAV